MFGHIGLNKTKMELLKRYKLAILGGFIIILLYVVYSVYFTNKDSPTLTLESGAANIAAGTELVTLLLSLQSITLDNKLFGSPEFRSLIDLGKTISPEPIGRANPFRSFEFFVSGSL